MSRTNDTSVLNKAIEDIKGTKHLTDAQKGIVITYLRSLLPAEKEQRKEDMRESFSNEDMIAFAEGVLTKSQVMEPRLIDVEKLLIDFVNYKNKNVKQ